MTIAEIISFPSPDKGAAMPPRRLRNSALRPREYLTQAEVEKLIAAARKRGRYGQRDACAILLAYSHGLRVSELVGLTWSQIDFADGVIHVRRVKSGRPGSQPLRGSEIRALRQLRRDWPEGQFVLQTERGGPWTASGFRKTLSLIGKAAQFAWPIHPHMLRHGCGFKLANDGVDTRRLQQYLGHRNITHTVRYSELNAKAFDGMWSD